MIVADTNSIAYFWIKGSYTKFAEKLLKKDSDWLVPFLWRSEFRNALVSCIRKNLLSLENANKLM